MRVFEAVLRKELIDNARDKRALQTALLITPLMGPVMLALMFNLMSDVAESAKTPKLPVIGAEHAPELIAFLQQQGTTIEPPPTDPEAAVREQDVDAVLVIPADYDARVRAGKPPIVELFGDSTRTKPGATLAHVEGLIRSYGHQIGAMRLALRGIDPELTQPIAIERREVASSQAQGALVLGMLPLMLLMACFIGGMYVAIDSTAGERERASLEPLLYQPTRPFEVMAAKMTATAVFSLLSAIMSVLAFAVTLPFIPLDTIGISAHLDVPLTLRLLSLLVPTVILGASLLLLVGTLSKTFRAAQAAISLIAVLPMIPGLIVNLFPQKPQLPLVMIPALGESMLSMQLIRGESVALSHQLALGAADLAVAGVLLFAASRMFGPRLLND